MKTNKPTIVEEKHLNWLVEDVFDNLIAEYIGQVETVHVDECGIDVMLDADYSTMHSFTFDDGKITTHTSELRQECERVEDGLYNSYVSKRNEYNSTDTLLDTIPARNLKVLKAVFLMYQSLIREFKNAEKLT